MWPELYQATLETLWMVCVSGLLSILIGLPLGILVFYTGPQRPTQNPSVHFLLNAIINIGRSLPFIILMIAVIPFTRFLTGTSIGTHAAIVPLTLAAIPFYARLSYTAFSELPAGLHELAASLGASAWQTCRFILFPEACPALLSGVILTVINLIGYSAMAGAVGGGGLGSLAIHYGYQRFNTEVMLATVIVLILLVQIVQWIGDWALRRLMQRT